jgi:hypothetical protein
MCEGLWGSTIGKRFGIVLVTQPPLEHGSARSIDYLRSVAPWHEFTDFDRGGSQGVDANSSEAQSLINVIGVSVIGTAPIANFDLTVLVCHCPNGHCFRCAIGYGRHQWLVQMRNREHILPWVFSSRLIEAQTANKFAMVFSGSDSICLVLTDSLCNNPSHQSECGEFSGKRMEWFLGTLRERLPL